MAVFKEIKPVLRARFLLLRDKISGMKILLLGSGGREHAFAWKMSQSTLCEKLYIAPGNAGTAQHGENVAIGVNDFGAIEKLALEKIRFFGKLTLLIFMLVESIVKCEIKKFFRQKTYSKLI